MDPQPGEIWLRDLGLAAKTRPVVIVSRQESNPPRSFLMGAGLTAVIRPLELALGPAAEEPAEHSFKMQRFLLFHGCCNKGFRTEDLVVVAAGENPNLVRQHLVDQSVLLVNATGPTSRQFVLQRLRLANARKRIALHVS